MTHIRRRRRDRQRLASALLVAGALMAGGALFAQPSVRAAGPTTATLTVRKGGDRTGPQAVGGLAGATFDFYAGVAGTPPTPGSPTATCVTAGAAGECSVDVPGRAGANEGYWIIERTPPAGFTVPAQLDTGPGPTTPLPYNQLFTGAVNNTQSYTFPTATTGMGNPLATGSSWADIRDNPALPQKCGLNIALLVDVSGSIAPDLPSVKTAANGFVDALTGTPSSIALFTFASGANAVLGPTQVSSAGSAGTVKTAINGLTAVGGTNWDAGLYQIAAAPTRFDAVLMLTDGNPTFYGPNAEGPGNFTRFREVENGIFSANAIKAQGTKIVAVGVGAGVGDSDLNLKAVSGPVQGVDYVQTDYAALGAVFREIALRTCSGTVNVVKKVLSPTGTTANAVPTGGWTFTASTGNVTPNSGVTAADSGAVSFTAALGGQPKAAVTLAETLQPGYTLVQVGGENATCTTDGKPVDSVNAGAAGFTVDALANAIVTCTVYNRAPQPPASVIVTKTWKVNGVSYPEPTQPTDYQAKLQLTGHADALWGQEQTGFQAGDSVTVGETVDDERMPPGCVNTPSGDLGQHTLAAGLNRYQVTNTVVCKSNLKLLKKVRNMYGPAEPATSWTLSAYPTGSNTPLITGQTGVSGEVTAGTRYLLGESTVASYDQERVDGAVIVPPSTGSWRCVLRLRDGTTGPEFDGLNGGVIVQLGQNAECTATNTARTGKLTLVKTVANTHGGTAVPTDWALTATPASSQHGATVLTGRTGEPAVTAARAVPGVGYTLSEGPGPADYEPAGPPTCVLTGSQTAVPTPGSVLTLAIGQDVTCTFANRDLTGPPPSSGPSATPTPSAAPEPMPVTGQGLTGLLLAGLSTVGAGAVLLVVGRRRRAAE